jgi:hypothetical protein
MRTINSDEHDAKHGVRSGREQPLAPEHRDKPGASLYQQAKFGKASENPPQYPILYLEGFFTCRTRQIVLKVPVKLWIL